MIAMPVTAVIVALLARWLVGLGWTESFLLGALLSPTDPVLSSGVVTDQRVPRVIRHSLNLESGLNDGLALPAVLAFAAALEPGHEGFVWWHFVLQDVGLGLAFGLVCGARRLAAACRAPTTRAARDPRPPEALYGLGLAFATYGLAVASPARQRLHRRVRRRDRDRDAPARTCARASPSRHRRSSRSSSSGSSPCSARC